MNSDAEVDDSVALSQDSAPDPEFGWPPERGSFVAATEANDAEEVREVFAKGAIRAWNLGRVKDFWEEGERNEHKMVELTLFGTKDKNTLTGTYGVARQGADGGWRFASTGPKGKAGPGKGDVYCWSECPVFEIEMTAAGKISKADRAAIKRVLEARKIPIEQQVNFV